MDTWRYIVSLCHMACFNSSMVGVRHLLHSLADVAFFVAVSLQRLISVGNHFSRLIQFLLD